MFIEIRGKGFINVNNVVMVSSKNEDGKYMVTLVHGGRIIVTQSVRDKIIKAYDGEIGKYNINGEDVSASDMAKHLKETEKLRLRDTRDVIDGELLPSGGVVNNTNGPIVGDDSSGVTIKIDDPSGEGKQKLTEEVIKALNENKDK